MHIERRHNGHVWIELDAEEFDALTHWLSEFHGESLLAYLEHLLAWGRRLRDTPHEEP